MVLAVKGYQWLCNLTDCIMNEKFLSAIEFWARLAGLFIMDIYRITSKGMDVEVLVEIVVICNLILHTRDVKKSFNLHFYNIWTLTTHGI